MIFNLMNESMMMNHTSDCVKCVYVGQCESRPCSARTGFTLFQLSKLLEDKLFNPEK